MCDPHDLGAHSTAGTRQTAGGAQRSAGYLEGNAGRLGQRTADNHQSSPGANIDSGGKLQQIFAVFVPTTDKNRNGQLQPRPVPALSAMGVVSHGKVHSNEGINRLIPHLRCQTAGTSKCYGINGQTTRAVREFTPDAVAE